MTGRVVLPWAERTMDFLTIGPNPRLMARSKSMELFDAPVSIFALIAMPLIMMVSTSPTMILLSM